MSFLSKPFSIPGRNVTSSVFWRVLLAGSKMYRYSKYVTLFICVTSFTVQLVRMWYCMVCECETFWCVLLAESEMYRYSEYVTLFICVTSFAVQLVGSFDISKLSCKPPTLVHTTKEGISRCCIPQTIPPGQCHIA